MIFRKRLLILALASVTILGTSCEEEVIPDTMTPTIGGTMTLKVDGDSWDAVLGCLAVKGSGATDVMSITGTDAGAKQCGINITDYTGPGTYTQFGGLTDASTCRWTGGLNPTQTYTTFAAGSGVATVEILTETADEVTGTFEFSAMNTEGDMVVITEGEFSADVQ